MYPAVCGVAKKKRLMKTDTEDTVRVTITFNRASNPEWYNVISGITSGRARSEIVKTHLTVPSLERFARNRREPLLADEPKSGSYPAPISCAGGIQGDKGRVIFATT